MENKELENKAVKTRTKKAKNKFVVINEFCGIEKGTELTIDNPEQARYMKENGYVKIKNK